MSWFDDHPILTVLVASFILCMCAGSAGVALDIDKCNQIAEVTGLQTQYHREMMTCLVKIDDQWVPYDRWVVKGGSK